MEKKEEKGKKEFRSRFLGGKKVFEGLSWTFFLGEGRCHVDDRLRRRSGGSRWFVGGVTRRYRE